MHFNWFVALRHSPENGKITRIALTQDVAAGKAEHTQLFPLDDFIHDVTLLRADALELDQLTAFSRLTLETLRGRVSRGKVIAYGGLAAATGRPAATRATAAALRNNPFPLYFPCHRVVVANLRLGGFMGERDLESPAVQLKKALLLSESVKFIAEQRIDSACLWS